ncbi:glycosyl hydrolase [Enterococcus faecalis]|nr:glycosyl hydrolase [Enterococcus faecalis]
MKNRELIDNMTLTEKARIMSGASIWKTVAFPNLDIPALFLSDGPTGLRKQSGSGDHLGLNASIPSTCYPTAATIANSWDLDLAETIGRYLGDEALEQEIDVILGPGLNIKRSPLCGRNFEYFSEDPYLSGKMAAAYIKGIQKKGVSACPKHFAANSQELRRMANNSVVDERALREIYLTGFEIAVKEAKPKSIMTAYNRLNGVYANESSYLLQKILKDEWGFTGFVVSDWGGSNDHVEGVKNGSHLEMPGTGNAGALEIVEAVESGLLAETILDERVDELLTVILAIHDQKQAQYVETTAAQRNALARKAAAQSIVMLKNKQDLLPLNPLEKVAIVGDFAKVSRYQGAGSSLVNPIEVDTIVEAAQEYELEIVGFVQGYDRKNKLNNELLTEAVTMAAQADTILLCMGLTEISEVEGLDREHMRLPKNQEVLLYELAKLNKKIVVVLSSGSAIEMPWIEKVDAVIHCYLGGQASAHGALDVLTGKVNPSGKLNESYPISYSDTPAAHYYPGKEYNAEYRESIYVGYRYYDKVKKPVLFPFGYGLSYTTFAYTDFVVTEQGVSCTLENSGKIAGAEVLQLYVGKKDSAVFRPTKELKGFKKVFLKPGEKATITIPFDSYTFRFFNPESNQWEIEAGEYLIGIGTSSQDIKFETSCNQQGVTLQMIYDKEKLASYFSGEVNRLSKADFEALYQQKITGSTWDREKELGMNDTLSQMFYAKSILARGVYRILTNLKNKSIEKGEPNLNILFNYNMPFRAIAKMTGGNIDKSMVKAILMVVNGHFFKGTKQLWKGFFLNKKIKKAQDLTKFERKLEGERRK